jgi:hypothetical protein
MTESASQRLALLYKKYGDTEVAFNARVILSSGLLTGDIHLKVGDHHQPCVLYACSMKGARVIAEIGSSFVEVLARHNNVTALRLGFRQQDEPADFTFFVSSRVESLSEYHPHKPQFRFISLSFVQRPPDALIGILGSLIEITANEIRRRDERIVVNDENMKKIGLESKESCVAFAGSARRCIVRDLSFSGAKILVTASGSMPGDSRVVLKLSKCEKKDATVLDGSVVRVEEVEGRNDVVAMSIQYSSEPPISYLQKINSYFVAQGSPG